MRIPFPKKNNDKKKAASLFGDTIFGETFSVSPSPKINFGTFQIGIAQLMPRVSGSVGVTPAHFPPPLQLLLFGDTFCHTFDREQQLR